MQTERLGTLGLMVGSVLHDLHNPLTNLSVNLERLNELAKGVDKLQQALESGTPTKKDKAALKELARELPALAKDLLTSCTVMRDMTVALKQFVRSERDPSAPPPAIDPLPIINYAIQVCRETAVLARGRIRYEGAEQLPRLRIGSTELTQVLINVVNNAAQALLDRNKSGGRVTVGAVDAGALLQLSVADNGVGMSEEVLRRVGTPFFSTRSEGTGLGVAQCRRLVEGAGGSFHIESTEGQGTSVTLAIPKA
jgi:signal transduction histidine kinase